MDSADIEAQPLGAPAPPAAVIPQPSARITGPEPRMLTAQDIDRIAPPTRIVDTLFGVRVMEEMLMDMLLVTFNKERLISRFNRNDHPQFTIPFTGMDYPGLTLTNVVTLAEVFKVKAARMGYDAMLCIVGLHRYFIRVNKRMTPDA